MWRRRAGFVFFEADFPQKRPVNQGWFAERVAEEKEFVYLRHPVQSMVMCSHLWSHYSTQ